MNSQNKKFVSIVSFLCIMSILLLWNNTNRNKEEIIKSDSYSLEIDEDSQMDVLATTSKEDTAFTGNITSKEDTAFTGNITSKEDTTFTGNITSKRDIAFIENMKSQTQKSLQRTENNNNTLANAEEQVGKKKLKTGLFVQSIKFVNSLEVNITGYIWQKNRSNLNKDDREYNIGDSCDFIIFPESVDTKKNIFPKVDYISDNVIGCYFEATFRQKFDYSKYPFDHKNVWIRIWPTDEQHVFDSNTILSADYESYFINEEESENKLHDVKAYDPDIVLNSWKIEKTFFDSRPQKYTTNFGLKKLVNSKNNSLNEFYFIVNLKRESGGELIRYGLPLIIVSIFLGFISSMSSDKKETQERYGFSSFAALGVCSTLIFVLLLNHIQIKQDFGSGTYMGSLYSFMYVVAALVAVDSYMITRKNSTWYLPIQRKLNSYYWISTIVIVGCTIITIRYFNPFVDESQAKLEESKIVAFLPKSENK